MTSIIKRQRKGMKIFKNTKIEGKENERHIYCHGILIK